MDKATRRQINAFEKRAGEAVRLKEKAANLLKKAGDIEVAQKAAFDAIILKTAHAAGLDALPLGVIVAGFAALWESSKRKKEQAPDSDRVQSDEATINLVVDIGRNTSKERFVVLDQYLTWNGKNGEWSGSVTKAALTIFESIFEPRRLKYSTHGLQNLDIATSKTITPTAEKVAHAALGIELEPPESSDAIEVDNGISGEVVTAVPVPAEREVQEATCLELNKAIGSSREDSAAATGGLPSQTIGAIAATSGVNPFVMSKPMVAGLPRSPFAGLRPGGQR